MAALSVRTSSSEEESRSTDEDERMLTTRCIEKQWKKHLGNTSLRMKRLPKDETVKFQLIARKMCTLGWVRGQGPRQ